MNEFREIRERVSIIAIAELYGLEVNRSGMCCCPFHSEKTASMKLYEKDNKFHCFGCGKSGDGIDLCSELTGLPPKEAAKQLSDAFGLGLFRDDRHESKAEISVEAARRQAERAAKQAEEQWIKSAFIVVREYNNILNKWEKTHRPSSQDISPDPLFVESLTQKSSTEMLLDRIQHDSHEVYENSRSSIENIARRLREIRQQGLDKIKPVAQEISHERPVSHGHMNKKQKL